MLSNVSSRYKLQEITCNLHLFQEIMNRQTSDERQKCRSNGPLHTQTHACAHAQEKKTQRHHVGMSRCCPPLDKLVASCDKGLFVHYPPVEKVMVSVRASVLSSSVRMSVLSSKLLSGA